MNLNAGAVERLLLKTGEQPTAAHLNALSAVVAQQQSLRTGGLRRRVLPWGTHEHFTGSGGRGYVSPYFEPRVSGGGSTGFEIQWSRGLIGGVEPVIDGVPISGHPQSGIVPAYRVPAEAFDANGEARVYFRLTLGADFTIVSVEPIALAKVPPLTPRAAYCLALLLFKDGTHWRKLVANQGHRAINRRPDGTATHIFWAKF